MENQCNKDEFKTSLSENTLCHHMYEQCCVTKRGLTACAKGIGAGQPARTAQADLGRNHFGFQEQGHLTVLIQNQLILTPLRRRGGVLF